MLTDAINAFNVDFYKEVSEKNPDASIVLSPLSAKIVLALLSLGAQEDTLEELNAGLHLTDTEFTKSSYKPTIEKINASKGVILKSANKIFVKDHEDYEIAPEFLKHAVEVFSSDIQNVNFQQPKDAAEMINNWVLEKTGNKINNLIDKNSLSSATTMILVNAIYFEAKWKNQFELYKTRPHDFHLSSENKITVEMMHTTKVFPYADMPDWNAKVLELPYEENDTSMVIILPNEIDGLKNVESLIKTGSEMVEAFKKLNECTVIVSLPRFKVETSLTLVDTLKNLNIKKIFEGNANLGGIFKKNSSLSVSDVIQKAFIGVSEKGTIAAVASAVRLMGSGLSRYEIPPVPFNADHPFIFCIKTAENIPIFIGKYTGKE